jgi:hypothetical protein
MANGANLILSADPRARWVKKNGPTEIGPSEVRV